MTPDSPRLEHLPPASGELVGLAREGAAVRLLALPTASATPASEPFDLPAGPAVTGAAARTGDVFVPDPTGQRLLRWTACDGTVGPLACFGDPGADGSSGLETPIATAIGPSGRLFLADSERRTVFVVDTSTGQLRDEWDVGPDSPIAVAVDQGERVYVGFDAPADGRAVRRFDARGRADAAFVLGGQPVSRPITLLVTVAGGSDALAVLDARAGASSRLRAFTLDGTPIPDVPGWPRALPHNARTLAVAGGRVYVGTDDAVIAFDESGRSVGPVADLAGPVRALVVDCHGHLLGLAGNPARLVRIVDGTTWTTSGSFTVFVELDRPAAWHHVDLLDTSLPSRTHVRLFTCSTEAGTPAPPLGGDRSPVDDIVPTNLGRWREHPVDAGSVRTLLMPGGHFTIVGRLEGDGSASPTVGLIRVAYDRPSWLAFLPAIYERDDPPTGPALAEPDAESAAVERARASFLERALAFLERSLDELSERIDDLPLLFDAAASPDGPDGWLDWLAGWLALRLDATRPTAHRRAALAAEFELAGIRGTARGLAAMIKRDTGIDSFIDEPASRAMVWSLGQTSILGFSTMVAPAEAGGAVLDTTAVLDGSHVIDDDEFGEPLFQDLVGRVCVRVLPVDNRRLVERRVRALLDAELPAHTAFHLCITEPAMRVGAQALIGIDSIVAGPPPDLVADGTLRLGVDTVLPDTERSHVSLGSGARVGHDAVVQ